MDTDADTLVIDSRSVGDPARFLTLEHLERALAALADGPRDEGRVVLIVRKADGGRRETPHRVRLTPEDGVPGDAWGRRHNPNPETQLAVMERQVAELVADGQPLALFGDNLVLDLDLSRENLPVGSRLRVGGATLEATPIPHTGCKKFHARFGADALRFVSKPELRHRNLRGIYLRTVEAGEVAVGDPVAVVSRPAPEGPPDGSALD
jgi:MOSC domain-containing protein YiiM